MRAGGCTHRASDQTPRLVSSKGTKLKLEIRKGEAFIGWNSVTILSLWVYLALFLWALSPYRN